MHVVYPVGPLGVGVILVMTIFDTYSEQVIDLLIFIVFLVFT